MPQARNKRRTHPSHCVSSVACSDAGLKTVAPGGVSLSGRGAGGRGVQLWSPVMGYGAVRVLNGWGNA